MLYIEKILQQLSIDNYQIIKHTIIINDYNGKIMHERVLKKYFVHCNTIYGYMQFWLPASSTYNTLKKIIQHFYHNNYIFYHDTVEFTTCSSTMLEENRNNNLPSSNDYSQYIENEIQQLDQNIQLVDFNQSYYRHIQEVFCNCEKKKKYVHYKNYLSLNIILHNNLFNICSELSFFSGAYNKLIKKNSEEILWNKILKEEPLKGYIALSPSVTQYLLSLFTLGLDGESIITNRSFITRRSFGTQIMSSYITIIDDPFQTAITTTSPIDAEGSYKKKKKLIQNGVLVDCLNNLVSAKILNKYPGNVVYNYAQDHTSISSTNLILESTQILNNVKLIDINILQLDPRTVEYNSKTGYISIEFVGKYTKANDLKRFTFKGTILDMFKSITHIIPFNESKKEYHLPYIVIFIG